MSRRHSHTGMKMFQRCALKWKYRYIDRLDAKEKSVALQRGVTLHDIFDGNYRGLPLPVGITQEDTDLLRRYKLKWDAEDADWTILHVEKEFEFDIGPFTVVFKPDLVIEINGEVWIVDHKTTANIPDEWDPYNMGDFQHLLYVAGMQALGYNVRGFLFNYIRTKPPTQPKLIKDGSRIADVRRVDTDYGTLRGFAGEHGMENDEDVVARLSILANTPDKFFQRHFLLVNDHAVEEMLRDVEIILHEMNKAEELDEFPRHVVAGWGGGMACSRCEFQPLCQSELLGMNTDMVLLNYEERPRRTT